MATEGQVLSRFELTQYGIAPASARVYAEIVGNPTGWVEIVASQRRSGTTTQTDAAAGVPGLSSVGWCRFPAVLEASLYGSCPALSRTLGVRWTCWNCSLRAQ